MLDICGNDIECNLIDFDPECKSDLSSSKNFEDNLIRRRRKSSNTNIFRDSKIMLKRSKRAIKSSTDKDKAKPKRKREKIEIRFKFIGKN